MASILGVWLRGEFLGELERLRGGRMRLRFAPETLAAHGAGSRTLSASLPLTPKRVEGRALEAFIAGLLPEQQVRVMIEQENGVRRGDDWALLAAIGSECAGAVQFLPFGETPGEGQLRPMTTREVDDLVGGLPTLTAPDALPVSASLGGVQAKVLLTETEDGWAWPTGGAMSTHLIKPEPLTEITVPHLIDAEHWAATLAAAIGLPAVDTQVRDVGGRRALVVRRYDRASGQRRHQEDFAQALALFPEQKYEQSATKPGRLQRIATEIASAAADPADFRRTLLRQVTFNLLVGNADAHSKNYSILIDPNGKAELSPLYDVAPISLINAAYKTAGHCVGDQPWLRYITRAHVLEEACRWGMPADESADILDGIISGIERAAHEVPIIDELAHLPRQVVQRVTAFRKLHPVGPAGFDSPPATPPVTG